MKTEDNAQVKPPAELQDFYERRYARAETLASIPRDDDFMYGQVLAQIRPYLRPGMKALDLGCNDGALSLYLASHGCEVLGIDLARNAADLARRGAEFHKLANARFAALDFIKEWHKPAEFDFVLCSHVIEHVPEDALFVKRIYEALKPEGRLVLIAPAQSSSLAKLSRFFTGKFAHDEEAGHLRRYQRQSLAETLKHAGFAIERVVCLDGPLRDWFILCKPLRRFNRVWALPLVRRAFNSFDLLTARFFFPAALCVHAKKQGSG